MKSSLVPWKLHVCSRGLRRSELPMYNFAISASYAIDDIGGGARKVIFDLNGSLGSGHFLYAINKRTSFASWANTYESSKLVIGLKWTSDQNVAYVFFTFEWNKWRLLRASTSLLIVLKPFQADHSRMFVKIHNKMLNDRVKQQVKFKHSTKGKDVA